MIKEVAGELSSPAIFYVIGNSYDVKTLREGCAARGEEDSCFATPLAREEFAGELFVLKIALKLIDNCEENDKIEIYLYM